MVTNNISSILQLIELFNLPSYLPDWPVSEICECSLLQFLLLVAKLGLGTIVCDVTQNGGRAFCYHST